MKRRDLERKLRIAGCYLKREGKSHSLWINPKTGVLQRTSYVPAANQKMPFKYWLDECEYWH